MGICIGGKACRRLACKNRCKAWFGTMPDVERSCKNACKVNSSLTKEDFLCSGNWIDQEIIFQAYGYDPCKGDNNEIDDFFDPLNDRDRDDEKQAKYNGILVLGGSLILITLAAYLYLKFK